MTEAKKPKAAELNEGQLGQVTGGAEVNRWNFEQAWPSKVGGGRASEIKEADLDNIQGGATEELYGSYNFLLESGGTSAIKPRLTDVEKTGIRAFDGTKIRK